MLAESGVALYGPAAPAGNATPGAVLGPAMPMPVGTPVPLPPGTALFVQPGFYGIAPNAGDVPAVFLLLTIFPTEAGPATPPPGTPTA